MLCLHREDSLLGFSEDEIDLLRRLGPHLGEGLRRGLTFSSAPDAAGLDGPGIIILGTDLTVMSINEYANQWLGEIAGEDWPNRRQLPDANPGRGRTTGGQQTTDASHSGSHAPTQHSRDVDHGPSHTTTGTSRTTYRRDPRARKPTTADFAGTRSTRSHPGTTTSRGTRATRPVHSPDRRRATDLIAHPPGTPPRRLREVRDRQPPRTCGHTLRPQRIAPPRRA